MSVGMLVECLLTHFALAACVSVLVQGLGFRVSGLGFRFRIEGLGFGECWSSLLTHFALAT